MKKLVFSFYISNDWETNLANLLHFQCLKYYDGIFDKAEIYILVDNKQDYENIVKVKEKFVSIFSKIGQISFFVIDNTPYRESYVAKHYVFDKLGEDELVFFAHNKGITNISENTFPDWYVKLWIIGLYFYSLNFMDEVMECFYNNNFALSYGPFLECCVGEGIKNEAKLQKYSWYYVGSFYWIHSKKLKNYIERNNLKLSELGDRFYSENVLADLFPAQPVGSPMLALTHSYKYLVKTAPSNANITNFLDYLYIEHEDYDEFFNKIMERI